jgi:hypothetical protein
MTPDDLIDKCRSGEVTAVTTHPMCGGLPPDGAWESLTLLAETVLPAVQQP